VGLDVRRPALHVGALLVRQRLEPQRLDDGLRDLVLQREDVVQVPIVALRPDVPVGGAVDELRGYPHAAACLAYAALEHVADPEFASDLRHVDVAALVHERAVA
jgi:hypothetical protein